MGTMELRLSVTLVIICCLVASAAPGFDGASLKNLANISYAGDASARGEMASRFSPRIDFEQWKPLTGRGDPLRNDPTYDYEPPVLERVHYWADEPQHERRPERKSEVLMLGISSRKPSVTPRQPPRRHPRPHPPKYQDYTYKLTDNFPMTILVPPPLPPPGLQPILFILNDEQPSYAQSTLRPLAPERLTPERPTPGRPAPAASEPTVNPTHQTSLYALQEANLIYQSSTTNQNWLIDFNQTNATPPNNAVSSDYAGWGPTTPADEQDSYNDTQNFIFHDHHEISRHPFSFYRPMLSESPPPLHLTPHPFVLPAFVPTAPTPDPSTPLPTPTDPPTEPATQTVTDNDTPTTTDSKEDTTTDAVTFLPTAIPSLTSKPESLFGMLNNMMSMPLVNGPERPEDALYAHASENIHVYKEKQEDAFKLESMQTMHPPPLIKNTESTTPVHRKPSISSQSNSITSNHEKPNMHTLDPYIHLRFTTASAVAAGSNDAPVTDPPAPTYLIIQGHSKVKTYTSKIKQTEEKTPATNEIPRPNETKEVKHLHPIKEKIVKKVENSDKSRTKSGRNLKSLLDEGIGSIEIQEADVGIKYDVSDGSDVPVEIYRKGFVESNENDYSKKSRPKRQLGLEDFLPFDEDQVEEYLFKFLEGKKNDTGIAGLLANAVTSDAADAIDDLDEEDQDDEEEDDR